MVCAPSLIERSMVTLASNRALLLVGEPGTAKSLLSELLAAAISGNSTLTIQGSAATTEDQIKLFGTGIRAGTVLVSISQRLLRRQ
jgi:MoxR-like ATPase